MVISVHLVSIVLTCERLVVTIISMYKFTLRATLGRVGWIHEINEQHYGLDLVLDESHEFLVRPLLEL